MGALGVGLPATPTTARWHVQPQTGLRLAFVLPCSSGQPPSVRGRRGGPGQQERGERSVLSLCVFLDLAVLFLNCFSSGCAGSQLCHLESVVVICAICFPDQGSHPGPLHWE